MGTGTESGSGGTALGTGDRLFGVETEYAFNHLSSGCSHLPGDKALSRAIELAHEHFECLADVAAPGVYMANGSRFYVDTGSHPEYSTPELDSPLEIVRHVKAGERIVARLAAELEKEYPNTQIQVFRSNVDYLTRQTWGCHESFQYGGQADMPAQLIPHLVTRLVYTGEGGLDPRTSGIRFSLSPRVGHLVRTVSSSSTGDRGIFHTKDEPLASGGFHRLHILCSGSLGSELGILLKIGTTALVVRLIEEGACDGKTVEPRSPLAAMQRFAADPTCTHTEPMKRGGPRTAVAIQRHYLEAAEASLARDFMPAWAAAICQLWRNTLDRLDEGGGESLTTTLDWAIKHRLYLDHATDRGFDAASLRRLSEVVDSIASSPAQPHRRGTRRLDTEATPDSVRGLTLLQLVGDGDLTPTQQTHFEPIFRASGTDWEQVRAFLKLRGELLEIDTRFGQLGGRGIFSSLERQGVLDHAIAGLGDIDEATREPPAHGRARARGLAVREHAGEGRRYRADWTGLFDTESHRRLDLSDSHGRNTGWSSAEPAPASAREESIRQLLRDRMLMRRGGGGDVSF